MPKDAQYVVTLRDGGIDVTPLAGDAPLVFTAVPADAELLAEGKLDLAVAFMQGRVKAAGDNRALMELLKHSS
jgi:hypothetical protein